MNYLVRKDSQFDYIDLIYDEQGIERYHVMYSGADGNYLVRIYDTSDVLVARVNIQGNQFEIDAEGCYCGKYQKPFLSNSYKNNFNDWVTDGNLKSGTYVIASKQRGYLGGVENAKSSNQYTIEIMEQEDAVLLLAIILTINNIE